jgi:hypothetical protein
MIENNLSDAVNELDHELSANKLSLDIIICGAFAIQLHMDLPETYKQ